ncbi:hypothetical protein ACFQDN_22195 [Pseudomonas asuensis]
MCNALKATYDARIQYINASLSIDVYGPTEDVCEELLWAAHMAYEVGRDQALAKKPRYGKRQTETL